jgi:para-aminobenzoate synthetase
VKTLIIDNYDSFTFNLFQMVAVLNGEPPIVVRNDQERWDTLRRLEFDNIIISPGPGWPDRPRDFGVSRDAIMNADVPILGVCLGHQGIGVLCGGRVAHAPLPMHGRLSRIYHREPADEIFAGIPQGFQVVRYHSLVVTDPLPDSLELTAWTEDKLVMGVRHKTRPIWGVQFHPESICSEFGDKLLANFRDCTMRLAHGGGRAQPIPSRRRGDRVSTVVPRRADAIDAAGDLVLAVRELGRWFDPEQVFHACYADHPGAFWLDSSLVRAGLSRFSYMGDDRGPLGLRVRYSQPAGELSISRGSEHTTAELPVRQSIFEFMRHLLARRRVTSAALPFDFQCGFVGYFGYELKAECGAQPLHRSPFPDAYWIFADRLIAFDHLEHKTTLISLVPAAQRALADTWFDDVERQLARVEAAERSPDIAAIDRLFAGAGASVPEGPLDLRFARDRERYLSDIDACMREIRDGETYEVCLTNQLRGQGTVDGLRLHGVLRRQNPAPYAAFLRFPELDVVCSSPERFLTIDRDGWVESKPIKGTLPRGKTPEEDEQLRERLRSAEKDHAENLMIVDLIRNDLGIVCEAGTVHVPRLMDVESYATVHQLVSTVRGRLRSDVDVIDCLKHAFPGGSMTGAPKLRTLELIDRLENEARGIYSGAIGYLSCNGAVDLNIVIRTAVVRRGDVSVGTGGAIVALSDPNAEFEEICLKSRALARAIQLASDGGRKEPS